MRIPLHLTDNSPDSVVKRVQLNVFMAQLNPKGFRTPSNKSKGSTRLERLTEGKFDD